VRIEIDDFSIESSFANANFLIVIFFEQVSPCFMEKKISLNFDGSQEIEISEHLQSISLLI